MDIHAFRPRRIALTPMCNVSSSKYMVRHKLGVLAFVLAVVLAVAVAQKSSGLTLEDRVNNLQDLIAKRPIIPINLERWKNYVRGGPRNYSMIVMFTALSAGVNCPICKPAYDEFYILANSYRYGNYEQQGLYFGIVEFEDSPQVFQQMNLNTAPVIYHFPAKGREKKQDQMEFQRYGIDADAMAKFVGERTGVAITVLRPPNYAAPAVILLLVMLVLGLLYMRRNNLEFLFNRTFWGLACLTIVFCFMSGQMWNHIRGPPFVMTHPQSRETSIIHSSTQYQLILETYVVLGLYAIITVGMIAILDAPERKDTYRRGWAIAGLSVVAIFFSLLLSVFRLKYQGYPYHFLFN
uniref:Magnesium transporter protein 1 n=1 Tax=Panagrellus redivivus TaxID=6233 RepID=A0A7E4UV88_PANRE